MSRKPLMMITSAIILLSILGVVLNIHRARAGGTIYIRSDGSIDPSTANITTSDYVTYAFIGNINDSIVVQRPNIIIDGAGYALNGTGTGKWAGVTIEYVDSMDDDNVTIKNVNIIGFGVGIGLISTEQNAIYDNNITGNTYGIWAAEAMNNTISGNNITYNAYGVYFGTVFYTELYENNITNNDNGVWLEFSSDNRFYHNWFVDNLNHTYIESGFQNFWNETYSIGGNFWDNFTDRYPGVGNDFSGPNQDILGSDRYWDGPYEIDVENIDHYPIVPEFPSLVILPLLMIITFLAALALKKKE